MDFLSEPHTPVEAVTLGLYLALTAPTDEKAQECAEVTEHIAQVQTYQSMIWMQPKQ